MPWPKRMHYERRFNVNWIKSKTWQNTHLSANGSSFGWKKKSKKKKRNKRNKRKKYVNYFGCLLCPHHSHMLFTLIVRCICVRYSCLAFSFSFIFILCECALIASHQLERVPSPNGMNIAYSILSQPIHAFSLSRDELKFSSPIFYLFYFFVHVFVGAHRKIENSWNLWERKKNRFKVFRANETSDITPTPHAYRQASHVSRAGKHTLDRYRQSHAIVSRF